jgi:hypothetical protein
MGSSTKTVRGVTSSRLVPTKVDTRNKIIINTLYNNKRATLYDAGENTVVYGAKLFNTKLFVKLGLMKEVYAYTKEVTSDSIKAYIEENIDSEIEDLLYYFDKDDNNKEIRAKEYRVYEQFILENTYQSDNSAQLIDNYVINGQTTQDSIINFGSIEIDTKRYTVKVINNELEYQTLQDGSKQVKLVNIDDSADEVWYDLVDNRSFYYLVYWDNNIDTISNAYIDKSLLEEYGDSFTTFVIPTKILGNGTLNENKFILKYFGLLSKLKVDNSNDEETLAGVYSNSKFENMLFAYMVDTQRQYFDELIQLIYGHNDKNVSIDIPEDDHFLSITYAEGEDNNEDSGYGMYMFKIHEDGTNAEGETVWAIDVNYGFTLFETFRDGDLPFYIIPLQGVKKLPLYKKYKFYEDCFSMLLSVKKRIKLKWYQTWWGQLFIGLFIGAITGGIGGALVGALASGVAIIVSEAIGGLAGQLISILVTAGVGAIANGASLLRVFTNPNLYLKLAQTTLQNLARANLQELQQEVLEEQGATKRLERQIRKGKFVLDPFSETHKLMDDMYNITDRLWHTTDVDNFMLTEADKFYSKGY